MPADETTDGRRAYRRMRGGAAAQPRRDHRVDHLRDDHAGRRHDDRQCRAAAYPGQPLVLAGPDRLGGDVLHRRRGDHDAADRLARRAVRHQIRVPDLGDRLHDRLGAVRRGDQPDPARALPPAARGLRRGAGAAVAIGAAAHQPARAARPGDGDLGHRHDARADHRPGARRLADRQFHLALGVLHQPAGRRAVRARHPRSSSTRPARRIASASTSSASAR